jgi:hypothetical protein
MLMGWVVNSPNLGMSPKNQFLVGTWDLPMLKLLNIE